jgi:hypothetical protein
LPRGGTPTMSHVEAVPNHAKRERKSQFALAIDRTFLNAAALAILVLGPFSVAIFQIDDHYAAEIPLLLFVIFCLFVTKTPVNEVFFKRVRSTLANAGILILPFALLGLIRGASFADVYGDTRAIFCVIASFAILFNIPASTAERFVFIASVFTLLSYVFVFAAGLSAQFIEADALLTGKITYPIFLFVVTAFYLMRRHKFLAIISLVGFAYLATKTSYRYLYIGLGLTIVAVILVPLYGSKRLPEAIKLLISAILTGTAVFILKTKPITILAYLNKLVLFALSQGLPFDYVKQLILKFVRALYNQSGPGDAIYINYFHSLLDIPRFAIPHGIGHLASLGSPVIFGGNTIDNTIIFLNYHFSIWVMFAIFAFLVRKYWQKMRDARWFTHVQMAFLLAPIAFLIYIRAVPFATISGGISLGFIAVILDNFFKHRSCHGNL